MTDWVKKVKDRTEALEAMPSPTWKEKVKAWQDKEKAELAAQHKETTQAMKILAQETEARRKEHIVKMKRYQAEHGVGPASTYSSAQSKVGKTTRKSPYGPSELPRHSNPHKL